MANTLGGTASASSGGGAASITTGNMSAAPTAGSTLVAVVMWTQNAGETFTSVTDAASNAYTKVAGIITGGVNGQNMVVYRKYNAAVVGSHTFTATWSATTGASAIGVIEIKGAATASDSFDVQAPTDNYNYQAGPGTGANAVTSTAATTTANGEFILGTCQTPDRTDLTVGTGFTVALTVNPSLNLEYQIQTTAGSIAATYTTANGGAQNRTIMATFKEAGASTTPITSTMSDSSAGGEIV